jgi:hypothetical protein
MNQPSGGFPCPACSRFMDPVTECPYCGAEIPRRRLQITLRWAAILFTLAGLGGLFLS